MQRSRDRRSQLTVFRCAVFASVLTLTSLGHSLWAQVAEAPVTGTPADNATAPQDAAASPEEESVKPGINERFLDPELKVDEWIERFEIESREVFSARERVLAACDIKKGASVADVGAGTGFYSRLFSHAVGEQGWVYSVDISSRFLEHINRKSSDEGIHNLSCILATERSTRLPRESVDLVFICDTYHHFEYPASTMKSILEALKPGGKLILIDFERIPGESREFILGHVRAGKSVFREEVESVGFELIDEVKVAGFAENYLLRFRKP